MKKGALIIKSRQLYGNALLLITAFIWGCAFVAQSVGAAFVEPFTFNGVRMVIGGIVLLPFIAVSDWRKKREGTYQKMGAVEKKRLVVGGAACGVALCIGAGLQQICLLYTSDAADD